MTVWYMFLLFNIILFFYLFARNSLKCKNVANAENEIDSATNCHLFLFAICCCYAPPWPALSSTLSCHSQTVRGFDAHFTEENSMRILACVSRLLFCLLALASSGSSHTFFHFPSISAFEVRNVSHFGARSNLINLISGLQLTFRERTNYKVYSYAYSNLTLDLPPVLSQSLLFVFVFVFCLPVWCSDSNSNLNFLFKFECYSDNQFVRHMLVSARWKVHNSKLLELNSIHVSWLVASLFLSTLWRWRWGWHHPDRRH